MTATVTALIELAVEHGWGIALLIIGAQVALDRLLPTDQVVGFLFGFNRSPQERGAHRRGRQPRPCSTTSFLASRQTTLKPVRCVE